MSHEDGREAAFHVTGFNESRDFPREFVEPLPACGDPYRFLSQKIFLMIGTKIGVFRFRS